MSTLDRYRKSGGFIQLLQLLESSNKQKQEQFFKLISQESKAWEDCLRQKMLTADRVLNWGPEYILEVFMILPPLTVGTILRGFSPDRVNSYLKFMGAGDQRKIRELLAENKEPSAGEKTACLNRLVQEARNLITKGTLKVDKFDPDLAVMEDIEIALSSSAKKEDSPSGHDSSTSESQHANMDSPSVDETNTALRFDHPSERKEAKGLGHISKDEFEKMRKKLTQMANEIQSLRSENHQMRSKLEQIKRIA